MKKKKPCPFCGSDLLVISSTTYIDGTTYAVSCRTVDCHGAIWALGYGQFKSAHKAIVAWNRRTNIKKGLNGKTYTT